MNRIKEWWHYWWDETLIIIGVSTVLVLIIAGVWHLFQTTPSPLSEGLVVGHNYTPQYNETHDGGSTCYVYDKSGLCTVRVPNPDIHHTHCVGGCYELRIDGCSNDRRGDSHCRKEWKDVAAYTYTNCEDGSYWDKEQPDCPLR